MTVHRLYVALRLKQQYTLAQAQQAYDQWIAPHDVRLPDERTDPFQREVGETGGQGTATIFDVATDLNSTRSDLLDTLEDALAQYVRWYRIQYHACDHDEGQGSDCQVNEVREFGPVPEVV